MKKIILLILTIHYSLLPVNAQDQHLIDSLTAKTKQMEQSRKELRNNAATLNDSTEALILAQLSVAYWYSNPDKAMEYAKQCLSLSEQIGFKKGIGKAYNSMGVIEGDRGNSLPALDFYKKALKIREELGDKKGIAGSNSNIATIYLGQSNYPLALKYYLGSLKMFEEIGNKNGIAGSYDNIGIIYYYQGNYSEALKNHLAALKITEEMGDKSALALSYQHIGIIYMAQGNYPEALTNYFASLKLREEIGDKRGIGTTFDLIGIVYTYQKKYSESLNYLFDALKIMEELGDKSTIAGCYNDIGRNYTFLKKYNLAREYLDKAVTISKAIGNLDFLKNHYFSLATLDSAQGNFNKALEHYKLFVDTRDSIINKENTQKTVALQMTYDFNKKQVADSIKAGEEKKVISAELKQEKTKSYALYGGLALLLVFGGFMFNRFKVTQKQKNTIETKEKETQKQKEIIEEKQKEITDSITYARRIQYSLLANQEVLDKNLNQHFVLYKPKDIVSGDFYWAAKKDDSFYLAVCDCTGHGVPGAFMSLLNINFLNEAVIEKNISEPNEIFNYVRKKLIANTEGGNDGMDATLIRFEKNRLTYTSANNKPFLISNNSLIDLNCDKMPVGKGERDEPFQLHELNITEHKGSTIYLFTDGYADQFGGENGGKKLTKKKFKELVLSIQTLSMEEQGFALDNFINNYRNQEEQIDDILVMGVRI